MVGIVRETGTKNREVVRKYFRQIDCLQFSPAKAVEIPLSASVTSQEAGKRALMVSLSTLCPTTSTKHFSIQLYLGINQ